MSRLGGIVSAENPPLGEQSQSVSQSGQRNKTVLVIVWLVLTGLWIVPSVLLNLYIFGGIDFPSERFSSIYYGAGMLLLYGTAIVLPITALILVRARDIGYRRLTTLLAVPVLIQVVGIAAYVVFSNRYGTVCC